MVIRQATYIYTLGLRIYNQQTEDFRVLPIQFGDDRVLSPAEIQDRAYEIFEIAKETDDQTKSEDFDGYAALDYQGLRISPEPPQTCLLYTSPSPRDRTRSRMPSSA